MKILEHKVLNLAVLVVESQKSLVNMFWNRRNIKFSIILEHNLNLCFSNAKTTFKLIPLN